MADSPACALSQKVVTLTPKEKEEMRSLVVKLPFKRRLEDAPQHATRRRDPANHTTTAGAVADVEADNETQESAAVPMQTSTSTINTMSPITPKFDPRMYGRERSSRPRAKPIYTDSVPRGPQAPAKKRKLSPDVEDVQSLPTPPPTAPSQVPTPPHEADSVMSYMPAPAASHTDLLRNVRPVRDEEGDRRYIEAMMLELQASVKEKRNTVHKRSAGRILDLLSMAEFPAADEAKFLSRDEALAEVEPGKFFNGPIITAEQQPLSLSNVSEFLGEYYENSVKAHIQDSGASTGKTGSSVRTVSMRQVKERFSSGKPENYPWNLLELATHHDDGLRPLFLSNEDCRLITKLKIPQSADETRRRKYEPGFKDVEKWALLAQAGALTEPHQDSHGYSTFITLNQGCIGFGWLSHPSAEERAAWRRNPQYFRGGRWRYVVLKPGQTVFFPAGTVHMVFRLREAGDSLAFGGHVLRCSNIVHWVKTLLDEHENPDIVNEDLSEAAVGYLERVEKFVNQAGKLGQQEKWGGSQAIAEFKKLKKQFMELPKPKKLAGKKSANAATG
ncbi:hypothetical protein CERZMDRAFT_97963 [Cercospora zeae-maydis SCOH1-5]|uniref:JmjC domain-containing protein n=1 Tax=Cercospora zeae-maydis SCOH1-5 TaxID=717836 RepID=A0A6A6FFN4_9PEZI|nr:hypothetical protein CERZMDRAFT_97963 [Cercospora zeae-maydis SCOH1-5]